MLASNAMPFTLPLIEIIAGTSMELRYDIYLRNRTKPIDLRGGNAFIFISAFSDPDAVPVLSKEMEISSGTCLDQDGDPISNEITGHLDPADTAPLLGKYIYQILIRNGTGDQESKQGVLIVYRNLDRTNHVKE